jgi:4-phospho-D-threonate 3-dehydrogenase / 4-phospho-D-erythronate 3-dehydrogenase
MTNIASRQVSHTDDRPIVAITLGDASGIGPELVAKVLADERTHARCRPIVVGDVDIVAWGIEIAGVDLRARAIDDLARAEYASGTIDVLDLGILRRSDVELGAATAEIGQASLAYGRKAAELARAGQVAAIVGAPTSKEARQLAGMADEIAAAIGGQTAGRRVGQMIGVGSVRAFNVTGHCAVGAIVSRMTRERILEVIRLADETLRRLGIAKPRIAVAGLNPHAGEHGLFGDDEARVIEPAIADARAEGIDARGPIPDDTLFVRAKRGEFDAEVCMYHAQSNVPVKMIDFGAGFSATCGLEFPLVTTAHGTGFDIAGKNLASERSLADALDLALQFATSTATV